MHNLSSVLVVYCFLSPVRSRKGLEWFESSALKGMEDLYDQSDYRRTSTYSKGPPDLYYSSTSKIEKDKGQFLAINQNLPVKPQITEAVDAVDGMKRESVPTRSAIDEAVKVIADAGVNVKGSSKKLAALLLGKRINPELLKVEEEINLLSREIDDLEKEGASENALTSVNPGMSAKMRALVEMIEMGLGGGGPVQSPLGKARLKMMQLKRKKEALESSDMFIDRRRSSESAPSQEDQKFTENGQVMSEPVATAGEAVSADMEEQKSSEIGQVMSEPVATAREAVSADLEKQEFSETGQVLSEPVATAGEAASADMEEQQFSEIGQVMSEPAATAGEAASADMEKQQFSETGQVMSEPVATAGEAVLTRADEVVSAGGGLFMGPVAGFSELQEKIDKWINLHAMSILGETVVKGIQRRSVLIQALKDKKKELSDGDDVCSKSKGKSLGSRMHKFVVLLSGKGSFLKKVKELDNKECSQISSLSRTFTTMERNFQIICLHPQGQSAEWIHQYRLGYANGLVSFAEEAEKLIGESKELCLSFPELARNKDAARRRKQLDNLVILSALPYVIRAGELCETAIEHK